MSTPAEIRARAAGIVAQVADRGRSLDGLLDLDQDSAQARGLLRSLCYGTLRWHIRLSAILQLLSSRPVKKMDGEVRALALVGLFQLLHTATAAHAAVAETVEAARVLGKAQATGFLNAILRRCQRESQALAARADEDLATRTAHPAWLVERLRADWPDDHPTILDANNGHPPFWLRVNTRRVGRDAYRERLAEAGLHSEISPHAPEALRLLQAVDVQTLPGFADGWVSVQDAAAQLAAHLLAPQAGQRVLDACAAPGGKTCHVLELNSELSELIALDQSHSRLRRVRANLDRLQLNATLLEANAAAPEQWWDGRPFDRILLDVPCSATGVIRRHPDIKLLRRREDIETLSATQAQLLAKLWPLLAEHGRLVYASCSVLKSENAAVIAAFLQSHADAVDITAAAAAALNLTTSNEPGMAIKTGDKDMDGFYYACLTKTPR